MPLDLQKWIGATLFFCGFLAWSVSGGQKTEASALASLLPQAADWKVVENIQRYGPETLYEYIDGAAEAYLSYDFKELMVAQFQGGRTKSSLTVEIYNMGTDLNAFGIYGAERFPESHFLPIGVQAYLEEGTLNFLAGRYYVKLMCYEGGEKTEEFLKLFAGSIADKIKDRGSFPVLLQVFPREGLIPNSEKFILRNFLGFKFLRNGFSASYKQEGREFESFLVQGKSGEDAEEMWKELLDHFAQNGRAVEKKPYGVHFKDSYLKNVFLTRSGSRVCGVTKIQDGQEALGERHLDAMVKALQK